MEAVLAHDVNGWKLFAGSEENVNCNLRGDERLNDGQGGGKMDTGQGPWIRREGCEGREMNDG